jgi:hypothetical protein
MLNGIFETITPESILNNPLYSKLIPVFISVLEEKCKISINMNNTFRNTDAVMMQQFIKMYAASYFSVLSRMEHLNLVGQPDFQSEQFIVPSIEEFFTFEHISNIKRFSENKGSKVAIEYANNLVESLNKGVLQKKFQEFYIDELGLFYFGIHGNLTREAYDRFVKPLAHPVGFIYDYIQGGYITNNDAFTDHYELPGDYNVTKCEVNFNKSNISNINLLANNKVKKIISEDVSVSNISNISIIADGKLENERWVVVYFLDGSYIREITYQNNKKSLKIFNNLDVLITDFTLISDVAELNLAYIVDSTNFDKNLQYATKYDITRQLYDYVYIDYQKVSRVGYAGLKVGKTILSDAIILDDVLIAEKAQKTATFHICTPKVGIGTHFTSIDNIASGNFATDDHINIRKYATENLSIQIIKTIA